MTQIKRKLAVGISVTGVKELPSAGRKLAEFLRSVDHDHGPFEIDIAVSVGAAEAPARPMVITVIGAPGDGEYEEVPED